MSTDSDKGRIVVGIDGSPHSQVALSWAIEEARLRGLGLRIIDAILTVKALYELRRTGGRYSLLTMCIGGGQGVAAIIELRTDANPDGPVALVPCEPKINGRGAKAVISQRRLICLESLSELTVPAIPSLPWNGP